MKLTKYEKIILINLIENELDRCYELEQANKQENFKNNEEYYRKKYMAYLNIYHKILNIYNMGDD